VLEALGRLPLGVGSYSLADVPFDPRLQLVLGRCDEGLNNRIDAKAGPERTPSPRS
jgi:hypothetical protein